MNNVKKVIICAPRLRGWKAVAQGEDLRTTSQHSGTVSVAWERDALRMMFPTCGDTSSLIEVSLDMMSRVPRDTMSDQYHRSQHGFYTSGVRGRSEAVTLQGCGCSSAEQYKYEDMSRIWTWVLTGPYHIGLELASSSMDRSVISKRSRGSKVGLDNRFYLSSPTWVDTFVIGDVFPNNYLHSAIVLE
jgi:hypothetical protein